MTIHTAAIRIVVENRIYCLRAMADPAETSLRHFESLLRLITEGMQNMEVELKRLSLNMSDLETRLVATQDKVSDRTVIL